MPGMYELQGYIFREGESEATGRFRAKSPNKELIEKVHLLICELSEKRGERTEAVITHRYKTKKRDLDLKTQSYIGVGKPLRK